MTPSSTPSTGTTATPDELPQNYPGDEDHCFGLQQTKHEGRKVWRRCPRKPIAFVRWNEHGLKSYCCRRHLDAVLVFRRQEDVTYLR